MTAKEKAEELYNKYEDSISGVEGSYWFESAKKCALVAVDEAINIIESLGNGYYTLSEELKNKINYLLEVKQEIENF